MPEYAHLPLPQAEINLERRPRRGWGAGPPRDFRQHGALIRRQVDDVLMAQRRRARIAGIDPSLILRVRMNGSIAEDAWHQAGLAILSVDTDKTLVLFSSDAELTDFRRRVNEYQGGPPGVQRSPPHAGLIAAIDEVGNIEPSDRIGRLLRSDGFRTPENFEPGEQYAVDVELWDLGSRNLRQQKADEIERYVTALGGRVPDKYVGRSLTLIRVIASGDAIRAILNVPTVAVIDLPPVPDAIVTDLLELQADEFPPPNPPPENAPAVAVLDTGLTSAHPLLAPAVGNTIGVPAHLGFDDRNGHGTRVAGIALYNDVRAVLADRRFEPRLRLYSAKIVNDAGRFDDNLLVASQLREAITSLHAAHGCRVFNISLGDRRLVYSGNKVGQWAAAIDELARSLNVVIVISAGNFDYVYRPDTPPDVYVTQYPRYLLDPQHRIIAPAEAALALTVGSICHAANVPREDFYGVGVRPIAHENEPSPFTRSGPGIGGMWKPELCDYGGNLMFDGGIPEISDRYEGTKVVTTHHRYLERLFTTAVGTSYAAPRVAHKAASLLARFPDASANLIRALLVSSAELPSEAEAILAPLAQDAAARVCGFGLADSMRASSSDDNRVVLYSDTQIGFDQFFVYEVPIVPLFRDTPGERHITVTLAFDPPVRHSRADYLGIKMSFRLIRGATLNQVAEFYRRRVEVEGPVPEFASSYNCNLVPTPMRREMGTIQRATYVMRRNPQAGYGDTYYLVVRCERRWADEADGPQRFAVVVDISHSAQIELYAQLQARLRARVRQRIGPR